MKPNNYRLLYAFASLFFSAVLFGVVLIGLAWLDV